MSIFSVIKCPAAVGILLLALACDLLKDAVRSSGFIASYYKVIGK
jgi:hypothetical protein